MPATRAVLAAPLSLLLLSGCSWLAHPGNTAPPPRTDPALQQREAEPPLIVEAQPVTPVDAPAEALPVSAPDPGSTEQRIADFIARVDDVRGRSGRRRPDLLLKAEQVAAEEPVDAPPVRRAPAIPLEPAPQAPDEAQELPAQALPGQAPATPPSSPEPTRSAPSQVTPNAPALLDLRAHSAPASPTRNASDGAPRMNSGAHVIAPPATMRELADSYLSKGAEGSFREQLDARLLLVLAGDYDGARAPLELVSQQQQEMATRFIEALVAIREAHLGDPAGSATAALAELERLAEALRAVSDLSIPTLALCTEVRGFGQYKPIQPARFPTGSAVEFVVYCEVRDFTSRLAEDNQYETRFDLRTAILTRSGDLVLTLSDENIVDRCNTRRRDCFVPRLVRLPATLSPGSYVVKVTILDKLGEKVAEKHATFDVVAGN